jgi:hypothetical protein
MDIITRQLRRAGAVGDGATRGMAARDASQTSGQKLTVCSTDVDCATLLPETITSEVGFYFVLSAGEQGPFGFKLDNGVIKTNSGAGGWQELTDANTLHVDKLEFTLASSNKNDNGALLACPKLCPTSPPTTTFSTSCWPKVEVRTITVTIRGYPAADQLLPDRQKAYRSLSTDVRLRNDHVLFTDTANPNQICPV